MGNGKSSVSASSADWLTTVIIGRNPRLTAVRIVVLVALVLVVFNFVVLPIRVQGVSMLPNYRENRVNFVNRLAYVFHEPRRGDVVTIRYAGKHLMLMKRIIGLPGESVAFHQGRAYVNGQPLDEPYVKLPCNWELPPRRVGPNEFFVVGDNRSMAEGEHEKGKADRSRIIGKVML